MSQSSQFIQTSQKDHTEKWHSRAYLPHYDAKHGYQMITYRLADALPQCILQAIMDEKYSEKQERIQIEKHLDKSYGSCVLAKPAIAKIVVDNWCWFDGKKYELMAFVVMPNHVHLLIRIFEGISLSTVVHSWKSYTAKMIKKYLLDTGEQFSLSTIWQQDYWDRFIRDEQHFFRAVEYIHQNPVKVGLCRTADRWLWSSASLGSSHISRPKACVD